MKKKHGIYFSIIYLLYGRMKDRVQLIRFNWVLQPIKHELILHR